MNKIDYIVRAIWVVIFAAILFVFVALFTSCSSIKKLRKNVKQTEQVKTTEQTTKAKDSTVTTITKAIDSSGTSVTVVFENDGKDTATSVDIITYPSHKEDYFFKPHTVSVKTNRKPKSITVNQAKEKQQINENVTNVKTNETKAATTEKKITTQTKEVAKKKFVFRWWWILILLAVLLIFLWLRYNLTPATAVAWLRKKFKTTHNMKNLLLVLLVTTLFSSCWKWDKPTPPRELAQGVYQEERIPVYDSMYVWSVDKKQYVKSWGIARYQVVPIKEFEVLPTGKQVMKYSYLAGFGWLQLIGIILIIAVGYVLIAMHISNDDKRYKSARLRIGKLITGFEINSRGHAIGVMRGIGIVGIFAIGFLTLHPAAIARNNQKTITEKQLKHYQAIDPELNYFWDSVYKAGGITTIKQPK